MVAAKRQGRFEDQSEDLRQNKQHSRLSSICIGQAQVEEKTYKRRSQSAFSRTLSHVHARADARPRSLARSRALSLSLSLSFSLPPHALLHSLLFESWILLLSYKEKWSCNTDLPKSCNTVCPRPESCDVPRALMSVAPNLCCDETKNRGTYTRVTVCYYIQC